MLAVVAVGANLGDAQASVRQALHDVAALPRSRLVRASSLYRSAPYEAAGPDFINAVVCIETELSPHELLQALQALEARSGRERPYKNAPRTLDLDVIFHGDQVLNTATLTLPHPRWQERAFVLMPLAEICPARVSPEMLNAVKGQAIDRVL